MINFEKYIETNKRAPLKNQTGFMLISISKEEFIYTTFDKYIKDRLQKPPKDVNFSLDKVIVEAFLEENEDAYQNRIRRYIDEYGMKRGMKLENYGPLYCFDKLSIDWILSGKRFTTIGMPDEDGGSFIKIITEDDLNMES